MNGQERERRQSLQGHPRAALGPSLHTQHRHPVLQNQGSRPGAVRRQRLVCACPIMGPHPGRGTATRPAGAARRPALDRIGICRVVSATELREIIVTPASAYFGTPQAYVFPNVERKDGSERHHTHAILVFDEAVCRPILIGAGRFRGYGVYKPILEYI